jgi:hypothetical protein
LMLILLHIIATLLLLAAILGSIQVYQIKITTNLVLASLIGLCAIISCIKLATVSLLFYFLYGASTAAFLLVLTMASRTISIGSILSCLLAIFFWPEFICFVIFSVLNAQSFLDKGR